MTGTGLDTIALVSAVAGLTTAAAGFAKSVVDLNRQRADLRRLEKRSAYSVLEQGDLEAVGDYLLNTLGSIRLSDYVADTEVRKKTVQAIERIATFLGDPDGTSTAGDETTPDREQATASVLDEAETQVQRGNVWNALAAARRLVELRLRELFPEIVGPQMSASQMLGLVERQLPAANDGVREIRPALMTANAAIHGEDVGPERALDAIHAIRYGLDQLATAAEGETS